MSDTLAQSETSIATAVSATGGRRRGGWPCEEQACDREESEQEENVVEDVSRE